MSRTVSLKLYLYEHATTTLTNPPAWVEKSYRRYIVP